MADAKERADLLFGELAQMLNLGQQGGPTVTGRAPANNIAEQLQLLAGGGGNNEMVMGNIADMQEQLAGIAGVPVGVDLTPLAQFADSAGGTKYAQTATAPESGQDRAKTLFEGQENLMDALENISGGKRQKQMLDFLRENARQARFDESHGFKVEEKIDEYIDKGIYRSHVKDSHASFMESMGKIDELLSLKNVPGLNLAVTQIIKRIGGDVGNLSDYERKLVKSKTIDEQVQVVKNYFGGNLSENQIKDRIINTYREIAYRATKEYSKSKLREVARRWEGAKTRPGLAEAANSWGGERFQFAAEDFISLGDLTQKEVEEALEGKQYEPYRKVFVPMGHEKPVPTPWGGGGTGSAVDDLAEED